MDGNLRRITSIMVLNIYVMLYGHHMVMISRKGRPMRWTNTTSWLPIMITHKRDGGFFIISDNVRSVEERVHMGLNYNPRIVRKDMDPIDIIIIGVLDRVLVETILTNLPFSFFNM